MFDPNTTHSDLSYRDRTPAAVRADNLIRQRLRIGDPHDPLAVAEGLKRLFPEDARQLDLETTGLPSLPPGYFARGGVPRAAESLATSTELAQATSDVERDLLALGGDHRLKDITIELQGWGQAIRGIIADGAAAARLALDPRARDRLFAARRQLGDYARLARFVGALTAGLNGSYRNLAKSLDEVASLLFVLAGEALAGAGLGGGRFLLSVPASELQTRRDSVLMALRALQGTVEAAYGPDKFPWGLSGLRDLYRLLDQSGHLDLRALLDEPVLGRMMDELLERAGHQNVLGLRALGATAEIALQRLHRLLHLVDNQVQPVSPPLVTFQKAIQLFLDAFASSRAGYRLMFVGRAPIAFNSVGGIGGLDVATNRLINIVLQRARLAELLDCYLGCDCCTDEVICQILLDKLLYDTDRAIDLYTLGIDTMGLGQPEWRAAAYGMLMETFLAPPIPIPPEKPLLVCPDPACTPGTTTPTTDGVRATVAKIAALLLEGKATIPDAEAAMMGNELCAQRLADERLAAILATFAPGCVPAELALEQLGIMINLTIGVLQQETCAEVEILLPSTIEGSLNFLSALNDPDVIRRLRARLGLA